MVRCRWHWSSVSADWLSKSLCHPSLNNESIPSTIHIMCEFKKSLEVSSHHSHVWPEESTNLVLRNLWTRIQIRWHLLFCRACQKRVSSVTSGNQISMHATEFLSIFLPISLISSHVSSSQQFLKMYQTMTGMQIRHIHVKQHNTCTCGTVCP